MPPPARPGCRRWRWASSISTSTREPHTGWLAGSVDRDERGFLLTGRDLLRNGRPPQGWPLDRPPLLLETSLPGVFAAGDIRHGSVKRVASAVGEGATAIQLVHEYLREH